MERRRDKWGGGGGGEGSSSRLGVGQQDLLNAFRSGMNKHSELPAGRMRTYGKGEIHSEPTNKCCEMSKIHCEILSIRF